jgi:hypothetical protein
MNGGAAPRSRGAGPSRHFKDKVMNFSRKDLLRMIMIIAISSGCSIATLSGAIGALHAAPAMAAPSA